MNLFNDGITGVYSFNKKNAQMALLAIPVSNMGAIVTSLLGG